MTFSRTFYLNAGGLFDFDLTFIAEGVLFTLLAFVVTFVFISPITTVITERSKFINLNLRKSTCILGVASKKLRNCVKLLKSEVRELNREIKLTKNYTNSNFEEEILIAQEENSKILMELKGELSIKSSYIFSNFRPELISLTNKFFIKKFKSAL